VRDKKILSDIQAYVDTITQVLQLPYTWMDLAYDRMWNYKLIELNAAPSLAKYVRDNGDEEVVNMYKKIIQDLP
jgi:D-alanine-D-alanine ligase-like ATP-grasp enzyme